MPKLIKAFWFISVLGVLVALLYVYAALPEHVVYNLAEDGVSRDTFFYISLAIVTLSNFALYALSKNLRYKNLNINVIISSWALSFAGVLNFFFIVTMNFFFLFNSGEKFNYNSFGYLIIVGLILIIIWVLGLPVFLIREKNRA